MLNQNRMEERVARGVMRILVNAIDICVAQRKLGKRIAFAEFIEVSENVFTKATNQLTPITLSEMWQWLYQIRQLSEVAYIYAIKEIIGDQSLEIKCC